MNKLKLIKSIKRCYDEGGNIIQYLKGIDSRLNNTLEDILISYDFQAGVYNSSYLKNKAKYKDYHDSITEILNNYITDEEYVICEAGVGEATTFFPVISSLKYKPKYCYGFDISWSRIAEGLCFGKQSFFELDENKRILFVGDIFNTPFKDNSLDIVYTVHALEPNGGAEEQLLKELYRITSKYLILFEPIYELADDEAKKRMEYHGYVKDLRQWADRLEYNVVKYELLNICLNELNPTGVLVIEKKVDTEKARLCDPVSKAELEAFRDCYYCKESMLAYPMINNIPCLTEQNAIFASKFNKTI